MSSQKRAHRGGLGGSRQLAGAGSLAEFPSIRSGDQHRLPIRRGRRRVGGGGPKRGNRGFGITGTRPKSRRLVPLAGFEPIRKSVDVHGLWGGLFTNGRQQHGR